MQTISKDRKKQNFCQVVIICRNHFQQSIFLPKKNIVSSIGEGSLLGNTVICVNCLDKATIVWFDGI